MPHSPVSGCLTSILSAGLGLILALLPQVSLAANPKLQEVRERGHLLCGVSEGTPGFSEADRSGKWHGLEVEFCAALAAAVLGNKDAVKYRQLSAQDRYSALASGDVDVLASAATWTLSRDTELGIRYTETLFYDGQGFLVRRAHALSSVFELSGASICAMAGTSADRALSDFFRAHQMRFQLVSAAHWQDVVKAYASESCTLLSGDLTVLAQERAKLATPTDHILLPEVVLKEPIGPAVAQGDDQWFSIVRWTLLALISAEEIGLDSSNVDEMRQSPLVHVKQFLGIDSNPGQGMGLAADWAYQIVKQVGNYGEIFNRTLGAKSIFKLERGMNDVWTRGGLLFSPPFR